MTALHDLQQLAGVPVGVRVSRMCPRGTCEHCDGYLPRLATVYGVATLADRPARKGQATLQEAFAGP